MSGGFFAGVKGLILRDSVGLDKVHVHGDADFDYVDGVTRFAEFHDGTDDDVRFDPGEVAALFVHVVVVADKFEEKWDVRSETFLADALDPIVFLRINGRSAERRIIKKNFDGVGASVAKFCGGEFFEKTRETARNGLVIAGLFVGKEQACVRGTRGGGGETELGVEKNRAGMGRENAADVRFEIDEEVRGNFFGGAAGGFGE